MRKVILGICSVLLASSFQANAITKTCDGCSQAQFDAMAQNSLDEMRWEGILYLVDARNGNVRKYVYTNTCTGNPEDPCNVWAEGIPVEPHIAQGIAHVGGLIRAASQEVVHLNPDMPNMPSDVYQAVRESHFDDDVQNYINMVSNAAWHNQARDYLSQMTGDYFNPGGALITIKFVYPDGGYYIMAWDRLQEKMVRIEGTERDSSGNKVPLKRQDVVNQTYVFPNAALGGTTNGSDDFIDLYRMLQSMNVPIQDGTYGQATTYKLVMVCTDTFCSFYYVPM